MTQIPDSLYYLIGSLIIANLGSIGTLIFFALKATWWVAKLDNRVDDARSMSIRAHKRIDKLEEA